MCGIFAYIGKIPDNIDKYFKISQYRGPDKSNTVIMSLYIDKIYLGFHRLSINDLSDNALQPMSYINDPNCFLSSFKESNSLVATIQQYSNRIM